jgi:NADH:ubiquinone oxidoreductase subunit 2 (subunit N)
MREMSRLIERVNVSTAFRAPLGLALLLALTLSATFASRATAADSDARPPVPYRFAATPGAPSYSPTGPYLDWGWRRPPPNEAAEVRGPRRAIFAPQYGLRQYTHFVLGRGRDHLREAIRMGDWLLRTQDPRTGLWMHHFVYRPVGSRDTLQPPWGMALVQGHSISLLARLHAQTHRVDYLRAAERAIPPLLRPVSRGGLLTRFRGMPFYEEYPTRPPTLVLNGFLFTLLGLYDLSPYSDAARRAFVDGVRTLDAMLPLYDDGRRGTFYHLSQLTDPGAPTVYANCFYTRVHVVLLDAMNSIAPSPLYREYRDRWHELPCGNTPHSEQAIWGELHVRWLLPFAVLFVAALGGLLLGRGRLAQPRWARAWIVSTHLAALVAMLAVWDLFGFKSALKGIVMADGYTLALFGVLCAVAAACAAISPKGMPRNFYRWVGGVTLAGAVFVATTDFALLLASGAGLVVGSFAMTRSEHRRASRGDILVYTASAAVIGASLIYDFVGYFGDVPRPDVAGVGRAIPDAAAAAGIAIAVLAVGAVVYTTSSRSRVDPVVRSLGSPASVFLITVVPIVLAAGAARALRLLFPLGTLHWPASVAAVAAATMVLGTARLVIERDVGRAVVYALVAQVGYLLVAVAASATTGQGNGALVYGAIAYALGAVGVLAALRRDGAGGDFTTGSRSVLLPRLSSGGAIVFALAAASLAAVPPLPGFFARLEAARAAEAAGLPAAEVVLIVCSTVTLIWALLVAGSALRGRVTAWDRGEEPQRPLEAFVPVVAVPLILLTALAPLLLDLTDRITALGG